MIILYLGITVGVIIAGIIVYTLIAKRQQSTISTTPYFQAMNLMVLGKNSEAIEKLKQTVRNDTNNIEAYIHLGNLFRIEGDPQRAVKIHENLLVRSDLSSLQKENIYQHLIQDYCASKNIDKAASTAEELVKLNKKNPDTQQLLLSFYEEKEDWDKAYFFRQSLNKWSKKQDRPILAMYKVKIAEKLMKFGAEKEARNRFREAVKNDSTCVPAYLYWGDSFRKEKKNKEALTIWQEFIDKNPENAYLAFDRLKDVLFDLGKFSEIENIYKHIIKKKPKSPKAHLAMIDFLRKQRRLSEAIQLCQSVLSDHPDLNSCRLALAQIYKEQGQTTEALDEALKILNQRDDLQNQYQCSNCHYQSKEPLWHCPMCNQWNTFIK